MQENIFVPFFIQRVYYCSYGKDNIHGKETLLNNGVIEYLVLFGD